MASWKILRSVLCITCSSAHASLYLSCLTFSLYSFLLRPCGSLKRRDYSSLKCPHLNSGIHRGTLITSICLQPIKIIRILAIRITTGRAACGDVCERTRIQCVFTECFTANEWPMQLFVYCERLCLCFLLPFGSAYCHHFPFGLSVNQTRDK